MPASGLFEINTRRKTQSERLKAYLEAEQAILRGQSYTLEGRTLTRADLNTVRKVIDGLLADGVTPEGETPKQRTTRVAFLD